jgi:hypothetical protein
MIRLWQPLLKRKRKSFLLRKGLHGQTIPYFFPFGKINQWLQIVCETRILQADAAAIADVRDPHVRFRQQADQDCILRKLPKMISIVSSRPIAGRSVNFGRRKFLKICSN